MVKNKAMVRKGNEKDLDTYAKILQRELGYSRKEALFYLKRKGLLAAVVNGNPVGFLGFTRRGGAFYINDLDIVKGQRRKGYGSCLLHCLEQKAKSLGVKRVWLHVNTGNKSAIKFYARNCYEIKKIEKGYYADKFDAYVLSKKLTQPAQKL